MTKIMALRLLRANLDKDYPGVNPKMKVTRWNDHIKWADGSIGKAGECLVRAEGYRAKNYLYSESGNSWAWR